MFCEEIRIKQGISYISFCPLRVLYNSKFMLMATSLVTNAVIVMRVHCTFQSVDFCLSVEFMSVKNNNIITHLSWSVMPKE